MAMKFYTLEEMEDKYIGKVGTPERDQYEQELADELHAYHVGEAIKQAREAQSLTQAELGEREIMGTEYGQICPKRKIFRQKR